MTPDQIQALVWTNFLIFGLGPGIAILLIVAFIAIFIAVYESTQRGRR